MGTDFKKARFKLIAIYLLIIAGVVSLFSVLIIFQANSSFSDPFVSGNREVVLTADGARDLARQIYPDVDIQETEYEIENNSIHFTTTFVDENEIKIDLFTGEIYLPPENSSFFYAFVDDFDEKVLSVALLVFLLAAMLSVYVANQTLIPISFNMRKQKEFVSGAAHELRNPLAALHARIESTLRVNSPEVSQGTLQDLLSETKRLITLSEGLLSLEKGETESKDVKDTVIAPLVTSLVERVAELAKEKELSLTTEMGPDTLRIDSRDLETILYNLLYNAIKFTPQNGAISIMWKNKILSVTDTGIGISEKDIPHIFDRFYKVDTARTGEGNGLGLALVKEIVEKYGGKIHVKSELGKGSTFTISFT